MSVKAAEALYAADLFRSAARCARRQRFLRMMVVGFVGLCWRRRFFPRSCPDFAAVVRWY